MFVVRRLSCVWIAAVVACGTSTEGDVARPAVAVIEATPTGPIERTSPITFVLSRPVETERQTEGMIAVAPKVPISVTWAAADRIVATPLEPFRPNTRYTARLTPRAVGPNLRLEPAPPLRFHTPLFAVDLIDGEGPPSEPGQAERIERVRVDFTYPVDRADVERYVVVRRDDLQKSDIAFEIDAGPACTTCILKLGTPTERAIVEVLPELTPTIGGLPLTKTVVRVLDPAAPGPFRLLQARPVQERGRHYLVLAGTRLLADPVPPSSVRIEPSVDHVVRTDGRRLIVEGHFEPERTYAVSVESMAARDGAPLADAFEQSVVFPPLHGEMGIRGDEPVLSPTESEPVLVESVGVRRLSLRTFSVPIDNLVHILGELDRPAEPAWPSLGRWKTVAPVGIEGQVMAFNQTAVRLPAAERPGLRLLEVQAEDQPWLVDRRWIQAGWVMSAKQGIGRTRVQVLSAAKRRPIRNVEIRLRTTSNRSIGPILTDNRGVAVLQHPVDDPVELVIAIRQGATAVLDLRKSGTRGESIPLSAGGAQEAFVLPSQDRFRPGDPVPVLVIVRQAGLKPPPAGLTVGLKLRGPDGRVWAQQTTQLWRSGGARLALNVPAKAPFGRYTIEAEAEQALIGEAKVFVQAQRNATPAPPSVSAVETSTGSARLSWTPERPLPGRTLQVRWLAPAAGWVTVSLESGTVLTEVRRKVGQGPATFSLTVPPTAVPGAYLVVTFEPTDSGKAVGDQVWIEVGPRRPLRVKLNLLPDGPHRSGSNILARVQGRHRQEDVFVVVRIVAPDAVDPGLEAERDAFRFFHRGRSPALRTHVPTGSFPQAALTRFRPPAPGPALTLESNGSFLSDPVRLGQSGEKKISVTLPPQQGRLRVEAIAWSDSRIGTAVTDVEVRDPLSITAAAPSILTTGDVVDLPVSVFRGVEGTEPVRVTAAAQQGVAVVGQPEQSFDVAVGKETEGVVRVGANGGGRIILRANVGTEAAIWRQSIDVRPVGPPRIVGVIEQASLNSPATFSWPSTPGRSRLVLGSTPLYQVATALTRLARLDRDDIETAAARALARQIVVDLSRPTETQKVAAVPGRWTNRLRELERCLERDGPKAWPGGPAASAGSVVLAGHAVVRAAKQGRRSPNFDRWMRAVRSVTRAGATDPRVVAYGQWVLASAGVPDEPMLQQLQTQWAGNPPDLASGVGLAAALSLTKRTRQAAPFLKFTDVTTLEPADAAFVLAALADAAPNHRALPELINQVISAVSGARAHGPRTDAWALVGLAQLNAALDAQRSYSATVKLGEQELKRVLGPGPAVVGDFDDATRSVGDLSVAVTSGAAVYGALIVEGPAFGPKEGTVEVGLEVLNAAGKPVSTVRIGDVLTLDVKVGPMAITVPDLRIDIPIPSGLTITKIEPPGPQARIASGGGVLSFDLAASARALLQVKLRATATFAGDFALGPAFVSSALRASQVGASAAERLKIER